MRTQYVPRNWPVDCQCTTCKAACGYRLCDGDCRMDCEPRYDCQSIKQVEYARCGRRISRETLTVYSVAGGTITGAEIEEWKRKIDRMSHFEMAYYWRTAPVFPVFHRELPLADYFEKRFKSFGGMTPEISKQVDAEIERLAGASND